MDLEDRRKKGLEAGWQKLRANQFPNQGKALLIDGRKFYGEPRTLDQVLQWAKNLGPYADRLDVIRYLGRPEAFEVLKRLRSNEVWNDTVDGNGVYHAVLDRQAEASARGKTCHWGLSASPDSKKGQARRLHEMHQAYLARKRKNAPGNYVHGYRREVSYIESTRKLYRYFNEEQWPRPTKDIASYMAWSQSYTLRFLKFMESQGLIRRHRRVNQRGWLWIYVPLTPGSRITVKVPRQI